MIEFFKGTVTRKDWMAVGVILGATLLAVAIFVFLVHAEQQKKLQAVTAKLGTANVELQKALQTQRNIGKLREETQKVTALVETFEKRLPNAAEMPQLLKHFEHLAGEVGLEVTLKSQDPIVDQRKETIPYSVAARGNFHQITSFINRLERFERYLSISDLNITEQEDGVAEAKFTLSTYSFKQPGKAPAPPAGAKPATQPGGAAS